MRTLCLLLLVGLAGCAAGSSSPFTYNEADNESFYRSQSISLGSSVTGGLSSIRGLTLRAEGRCVGEGCAPGEYTVSLYNSSGNRSVTQFRQVVFDTGDGAITFGQDQRVGTGDATGGTRFFNNAQGEFVRISVPAAIFSSFANAETLRIQLGSNEYRVSFDARRSLRGMIPDAS